MRVVFLGTPAFAVPALLNLSKNQFQVCGVFTQPDRPSGRGHRLQPSPVKAAAQKLEIPVFQPEKIRNEECRPIFQDLHPDFIVVVAYGQILPQWLLDSARFGAVNIHASLLPQYRGAAPIVWALLQGDAVTGITTMMMVEKLDAGPILLQKEVPISVETTAGELTEELSQVGADIIVTTLELLAANRLNPVPQNEKDVSWAPRITKEMAKISWEKSAAGIHNQIRALNPWPIAYTVFDKERLQILRSFPQKPEPAAKKTPGTFLGFTESGICVQCGEGTTLEILEVKSPGKSRISGRAFAAGSRIQVGQKIFSQAE